MGACHRWHAPISLKTKVFADTAFKLNRMIKRLTLAIIAAMAVGASTASAVPNTHNEQSTQSTGISSIEAMRVSVLFNSLAEQTAYILNSNTTPGQEELEMYIDTIQRIATYADSNVPLTETDLDLLVDSFYEFVHAGGETITKKDIREDLSRFPTLGEAVGYLAEGMMAGL